MSEVWPVVKNSGLSTILIILILLLLLGGGGGFYYGGPMIGGSVRHAGGSSIWLN
jgi:hypothetical protein